MVSAAADGKGNVVVAYPDGLIAIVNPQNEFRVDVPVIRLRGSRLFDSESGALYEVPKTRNAR